MGRCADCPVPPGLECPSRYHARTCELAKRPEYRQTIIDQALVDAGKPATQDARPAGGKGKASGIGPLVQLIWSCDYRAALSGDLATCGCSGRRFACLAGRGDRVPGMDVRSITLGDCLACVGA
jgi:hypothetical protein